MHCIYLVNKHDIKNCPRLSHGTCLPVISLQSSDYSLWGHELGLKNINDGFVQEHMFDVVSKLHEPRKRSL